MTARRLILLALLAAASSADVTCDRLLRADREPHNWLTYSGNYSSHRYSPLPQIGYAVNRKPTSSAPARARYSSSRCRIDVSGHR